MMNYIVMCCDTVSLLVGRMHFAMVIVGVS